jgi:hypothetical protein
MHSPLTGVLSFLLFFAFVFSVDALPKKKSASATKATTAAAAGGAVGAAAANGGVSTATDGSSILDKTVQIK